MKHLFSIYSKFITLTVVLLLFSACSSSSDENASQIKKQDSLAKINGSKNPIEAPDTSYTGDFIEKYPNGIIKYSGYFRFGKRHGLWRSFYENGELWSECYYHEGFKNGSYKINTTQGITKIKGWHKNNLKDSLWFFYDDSGKLLQKTAFKNDAVTVIR